MPLIARCFHRTKEMSVDVTINDLQQFVGALRTDGYLLVPGAFIPYEDISLIVTYEGDAQNNILHLVPKGTS